MHVHRLDTNDHDLLDAAVRMFRGTAVEDHSPFLTDPATIAFVALENTTVVGWAWGTRQHHAAGYSQVQLYEIEVAAEWRQRGIGRALITEFLTLVTREGHRRMWLFTDEANTPAQALYRSVGGEPSLHDDAAFWWQLRAA